MLQRCGTKGVKNSNSDPVSHWNVESPLQTNNWSCFSMLLHSLSGVRCIALTITWQRIWCLGCLPLKYLQTLQASRRWHVPASSSIPMPQVPHARNECSLSLRCWIFWHYASPIVSWADFSMHLGQGLEHLTRASGDVSHGSHVFLRLDWSNSRIQ